MKLFSILLALLATTTLAFADTKNEPAPADVQKWLAFFDKIVDTIVADQSDCPKMGSDLSKLMDANAALIKMANDSSAKGQKLPKSAEDHMKAGVQKMMPGLQKCGQDKSVQAALAKLDMKKSK